MIGEFGEITKSYTVTFTRTSKHSAARFWRAITEPDEIAKWMGGPAKVDMRVGGEWFVDFPNDGDGDLTGVIVRVEPGRVLTFVWGLSVVEWTISEADGGHGGTLIDAVIDCDPRELGYGYTGWTNALLQRYLAEVHGLTVSRKSVSLALTRLDIRWKRPRHQLALRPETWRQSKGGSNAAWTRRTAPSC